MNVSGLNEEEKLLINSGLSMVGGAVVGVAQAEYQYLTTNGHITLGGAISFALATFGVLLGVALRAYVPTHAQQMLVDAEARAAQLEEALHLATNAQPVVVTPAQPTPVAAPVSPVTIHFNGVPVTQPMQIDASSGAMTLSTTGLTAIQNSGTPIVIPPTGNVAGTSTILPGTAVQPASVQLTMSPAPSIASTPDLASEDTAVRKSVTIVS